MFGLLLVVPLLLCAALAADTQHALPQTAGVIVPPQQRGATAQAAASTPTATLCYHGHYPDRLAVAYVPYLQQHRYPNVRYTAVGIGYGHSEWNVTQLAAKLRQDIARVRCAVVIELDAQVFKDANHTLERLRTEPGMPLWVDYRREPREVSGFEQAPRINAAISVDLQGWSIARVLKALGWDRAVSLSSAFVVWDKANLDVFSDLLRNSSVEVETSVFQDFGTPLVDVIDAISTAATRVVAALIPFGSPLSAIPGAGGGSFTVLPVGSDADLLAGQVVLRSMPAAPLRDDWRDPWMKVNMTELGKVWGEEVEPSAYWKRQFTYAPFSLGSPRQGAVLRTGVAMAVVAKYYEVFGPTAAPPSRDQLLMAAQGLEIETLSDRLVLKPGKHPTVAWPSTMQLRLAQPSASNVTVNTTTFGFTDMKEVIIGETDEDGVAALNGVEAFWPGVGWTTSIPGPMRPPPALPPADPFPYVITAVTAFAGLLVLGVFIAAIVYLVVRWRRTRFCPTDPELPFAAFYVTTKNEDELRDGFGPSVHKVFASIFDAVAESAAEHRCHVARRMDAHYLIVASEPSDAAECAADISRRVAGTVRVALQAAGLRTIAGPGLSRSHSYASPGILSGTNSSVASVREDVGGSVAVIEGSPPQLSHTVRSSEPNSSTVMARPLLPEVAIGIAHGVGHIDGGGDAAVFGGLPVDIAALVVNHAVAGEVMATDAFVAALGDAAVGQHFHERCRRTLRVRRTKHKATLFRYDDATAGEDDPRELITDADSEREKGEPLVSTLTAALQEQAGGLVTRRAAIVVVIVRELKRSHGGWGMAEQCTDVHRTVAAVAEASRGVVDAVLDGAFVISVNANGGVAQAPMRGTKIGFDVVEALTAEGFTAAAGVAYGSVLVGELSGTTSPHRVVALFGSVLERARGLVYAAAELGVAVAVTAAVRREAEQAFDFVAADVVAARLPVKDATMSTTSSGRSSTAAPGRCLILPASSSNGHSEGPKEKGSGISEESVSKSRAPLPIPTDPQEHSTRGSEDPMMSTATVPAAAVRLMRGPQLRLQAMNADTIAVEVHAVVAPSSAADVPDEWMYQLAEAGSSVHRDITAAFSSAVRGDTSSAAALLANVEQALAVAAGGGADTMPPEAPLEDASPAQRVVDTAAGRCRVLCDVIAGSVAAGRRQEEAVLHYGVTRLIDYVLFAEQLT